MGTGVAAVIIARERRIVEAFQLAGATSPQRAIPLHDASVGDGIALRRLRDHAVIREGGPDLFYVDIEVWNALGRMRRRIVFTLLLVLGFWIASMAWTTRTIW